MIDYKELKVLAAFFPELEEKTAAEIEKRSGYSHERVYTMLNSLEKKGLLLKKRFGRTFVYYIERFSDLLYLAFTYYFINRKEEFVKKYPQVASALDELISKAEPSIAVLFGSYSKKIPKDKSDVDVLLVDGKGEAEKTALSLRHKFNLRITPVLVNEDEFARIKDENPELWSDLIRFGVVLKGYELFYELAYKKNEEGHKVVSV